MSTQIARNYVRIVCCLTLANAASICRASHDRRELLTTVAYGGQQATGAPEGTVFTGFGNPVLNNSGGVAFGAQVTETSEPPQNRLGLWSERGGVLQLGALLELHGPVSSFALNLAFNDRGELAFRGLPTNQLGAATENGVWLATLGGLSLVVQKDDPVPNEPGKTYSFIGRPVINGSGVIAFTATARPDPFPCCSDSGIWIANQGGLASVARFSEAVPGLTPPTYFGFLHFTPVINTAGRVAFFDSADFGAGLIWTNSRGAFEVVARAQTPALELGDGVDIGGFTSPLVFNGRGDVIFFNRLAGASVSTANDQILWRWQDGQLRKIAREGDQAPGVAAGVVFDSITYDGQAPAVSNDQGDVAFVATLHKTGTLSPIESSIWRETDDGLELIARTGDPAPGTGTGTVFNQFRPPIMNSLGQIAFRGTVIGDGVTQFNDGGIWAEDAAGTLRLIVREGDIIDVENGTGTDLRTISEVLLVDSDLPTTIFYRARGENDQPYAFNNRGQIAFQVTFTDSTQAILVSHLLLIPEPSTAVVVLSTLAIAGVLSRRARLRSGALA